MSSSEGTKESFFKLLKAVCKSCKKASLKTYHQNIKRLYRLIKPEATHVPTTKSWLNSEELWKKYKAKPVNIRRHLSTAGVKSSQAYKMEPENRWFAAMVKDQSLYQKQRDKNEPSEKEKSLIPKNGLKAIKRSAVELKKRLKYILEDTPSKSGLYQYQWFIALKLYSEIPFRNTYADINISGTKGNHLLRGKKGSYTFIMTEYKNSDKLGPREVKISRAGTMALKKILAYREKVGIKHNKLFSTKTGGEMSKATFGKGLQATTSKLLGKAIGSRIIRILHASSKSNKEAIEKASELTNKLLHTASQTKQYVRK